MKRFPVGVQPYTIREELAKDYFGSIEKLAKIGFQGIELGLPPKGVTIEEQKALLDRLGLRVTGCHAGFNTLDFDPEKLADYLEAVDAEKFVAISLLFDSKEDLLDKAKKMNAIGKQFRKRGVTFLYHNHDWEFRRYDGEYAMDILLRETDPELVQTEMDTYWIAKGGEDPAAYLRKLTNRAPLLHVKDMEAGEERFFAEVGEGVLDFHEIAAAAEEAGTRWLIVEQDQCRRDPFDSLRISYENLRSKIDIMADNNNRIK